MIQNGMIFGGDGPIMQGTWYNAYTGDAFTVKDSFFEDNQYVVTTTDGRFIRYDQLQNYIQSDMKLEDLKKMKIDKSAKEVLPTEVAGLIDNDPYSDMMLPEDELLMQPKIGNIYTNSASIHNEPMGNVTYNKEQSMNVVIIEKALKNVPRPKLNVNVEWQDFPAKQIDMLNEVMDIPEDDIVEWYLDNIDMIEVVEALKTAIKDRLLRDSRLPHNVKTIESTNINIEEPVAPVDLGKVTKTGKTTSTKTTKKSVKK